MIRSSKLPSPPPAPLALRVPRTEAVAKIQAQINEGEFLLSAQPCSEPELNALKEKRQIWSDYNKELLTQLFTSPAIAEEYSAFLGSASILRPGFADLVDYFRDSVQRSLTRLRSIFKKLELFPVLDGNSLPTRGSLAPNRGDGVFLVHGHNNEAKETVARFLERLDLRIIILHEQPDKGRTIIEKFEDHASVGYAVVLLTGDDIGASQVAPDELKERARQNVILELGYFLGTLGRTRVCALREDDVEVPSDLSGVLYIRFDAEGAWKFHLAKEIKAAGIEVDLNRVV